MCLRALKVANLEIQKNGLKSASMAAETSEQKNRKPVPYAGIGTLIAGIQRANKAGRKPKI
jgi:hypothetical protein